MHPQGKCFSFSGLSLRWTSSLFISYLFISWVTILNWYLSLFSCYPTASPPCLHSYQIGVLTFLGLRKASRAVTFLYSSAIQGFFLVFLPLFPVDFSCSLRGTTMHLNVCFLFFFAFLSAVSMCFQKYIIQLVAKRCLLYWNFEASVHASHICPKNQSCLLAGGIPRCFCWAMRSSTFAMFFWYNYTLFSKSYNFVSCVMLGSFTVNSC